jgi:hypothetical protein
MLPIIFNDTLLQCDKRTAVHCRLSVPCHAQFRYVSGKAYFFVLFPNSCAIKAVLILVIERNLIFTFERLNLFSLYYVYYLLHIHFYCDFSLIVLIAK